MTNALCGLSINFFFFSKYCILVLKMKLMAPNDLKDTDFVFTFFQNCSRFQNVTVLCSRLHAGQVAEGSFEECILSVGQTEI